MFMETRSLLRYPNVINDYMTLFASYLSLSDAVAEVFLSPAQWDNRIYSMLLED